MVEIAVIAGGIHRQAQIFWQRPFLPGGADPVSLEEVITAEAGMAAGREIQCSAVPIQERRLFVFRCVDHRPQVLRLGPDAPDLFTYIDIRAAVSAFPGGGEKEQPVAENHGMGFHLRGVKLGDVLGLEPFIGAGHEIDVAVAFVGFVVAKYPGALWIGGEAAESFVFVGGKFIHQLRLAKSGAENLRTPDVFLAFFSWTEGSEIEVLSLGVQDGAVI